MNSGSKSPIVVIGSSPTALTYLIDILENAKDLPSLITVSYTHLTLPTR